MNHEQSLIVDCLAPEELLVYHTNDSSEVSHLEPPRLIAAPVAQSTSIEDSNPVEPFYTYSNHDGQGTQGYSPPVFQNEPVKRSRLGPLDPMKATELRKRGVCFRCKVSKATKGCSVELPCQSCVRSRSATTGRKSLRWWMQCVAFAFGDMDIFAIRFPSTVEKCRGILQHSNHIVAQELEVAFEEEDSINDIADFCQEMANLLSNHCNETTSSTRLGVLASSRFQQLVSPLVESDMGKYTRLLIEVSLALRSSDGQVTHYAGYSIDELQHLQSFAGSRVIQGLEVALKNPFDKDFSSNKGRALFLTLLGMIVAVVNYSPQIVGSQASPSPDSAARAHIDIQNQLLRILAHHMIHIADCLKLLPPKTARDRIAQDPAKELGKSLQVQWIEDRNFPAAPRSPPYEQMDTRDSISAEQPRQAIVTSETDDHLPLKQCSTCKKMIKCVVLTDEQCSECQLQKFSSKLFDHRLSIKKIMDREDQASYALNDEPEPSHTVSIPNWELCVWCDSISVADGMCDGCISSNDPSYAIEGTNIPSQLWANFLAEAGSHLN